MITLTQGSETLRKMSTNPRIGPVARVSRDRNPVVPNVRHQWWRTSLLLPFKASRIPLSSNTICCCASCQAKYFQIANGMPMMVTAIRYWRKVAQM